MMDKELKNLIADYYEFETSATKKILDALGNVPNDIPCEFIIQVFSQLYTNSILSAINLKGLSKDSAIKNLNRQHEVTKQLIMDEKQKHE